MEWATLILLFPFCHMHEIIGFILAKQEVRKDGFGYKNYLCQSITIKTTVKLQASTQSLSQYEAAVFHTDWFTGLPLAVSLVFLPTNASKVYSLSFMHLCAFQPILHCFVP